MELRGPKALLVRMVRLVQTALRGLMALRGVPMAHPAIRRRVAGCGDQVEATGVAVRQRQEHGARQRQAEREKHARQGQHRQQRQAAQRIH